MHYFLFLDHYKHIEDDALEFVRITVLVHMNGRKIIVQKAYNITINVLCFSKQCYF
jgi:hypothetical protein